MRTEQDRRRLKDHIERINTDRTFAFDNADLHAIGCRTDREAQRRGGRVLLVASGRTTNNKDSDDCAPKVRRRSDSARMCCCQSRTAPQVFVLRTCSAVQSVSAVLRPDQHDLVERNAEVRKSHCVRNMRRLDEHDRSLRCCLQRGLQQPDFSNARLLNQQFSE